MTLKRIDACLDDLIKRYVEGKSLSKLAAEQGVSLHALSNRFHKAGITIGRRPTDDLIRRLYLHERLTQEEIGTRFHVTRTQAGKWIRDLGVARSAREVHLLRASHLSARQRRAQAAAANAAARGRKASLGEKCKRAATCERLQLHVSDREREFARHLDKARVPYTLQKAVGPYNLDIALAEVPVAVEVSGGGGDAGRQRIHRKRVEYILDQGISIVEVGIVGTADRISAAAADYVIAYADFLRRNPSAPREHRMIRADGHLKTPRRTKAGQWPIPARPVSSANAAE